MTTTEIGPAETCKQCAHPFDDHSFVSTGDSPLDGGVILCPVPECQCYSTWSAGEGTAAEVRVPEAAELSHMRAALQYTPEQMLKRDECLRRAAEALARVRVIRP